MLDHEDLKWIAATSTDLNSMLQQISRYSDLARRHKGEQSYIDLLGERVELAAKTAQALFDRVTSNILEKTTAKRATPPPGPHTPFTVLPPPLGTVLGQSASARTATQVEEKPKQKPDHQAASAQSSIPSDIKIKNPKGNRELLLLIEDEV